MSALRSFAKGGYVGRFAPSPTGRLHLGSLTTALAVCLDAKANGGRWLLRVEDIDPEKEEEGVTEDILNCLAAHGLEWDGQVARQSRNSRSYDQILSGLWEENLLYACRCSRQEFRRALKENKACRCFQSSLQRDSPGAGWRLKVEAGIRETFTDRILGDFGQNIAEEVGDFILKRKDGHYSYQLAVVADDAAQGITHVVRGEDLLDVTPRQIYLQKLLGLPAPIYAHTPMVFGADGKKLSKQNNAPAIDPRRASQNLAEACSLLNLSLSPSAKSPAEILDSAIPAWRKRHPLP